jgi:hypothetical protein
MNRITLFAAVAAALALGAGPAAHAECKMQMTASIPISFVNNQPMVVATINGKPANLRFSLNTETFLWGTSLKDYGLKEAVGNSIAYLYGLGGSADATASLVHELKMGDAVQKNTYYYMVYSIRKDGEAGVFGSSAFRGQVDIEIDYPHNVVRVFKASGCKDDEVLYWGGNYSVIERDRSGFLPIKLAGKLLDGYFDPGNEVTFVSVDGARHAGVTLQAAGPLPMGMISGGAVKPIEVSIANFPELTVGEETIKNAPLVVGDIYPNARNDFRLEIILGADFFRTHRVYISRQQRKIYFSYAGGTPFQDIYARLGVQAPSASPQPPKP